MTRGPRRLKVGSTTGHGESGWREVGGTSHVQDVPVEGPGRPRTRAVRAPSGSAQQYLRRERGGAAATGVQSSFRQSPLGRRPLPYLEGKPRTSQVGLVSLRRGRASHREPLARQALDHLEPVRVCAFDPLAHFAVVVVIARARRRAQPPGMAWCARAHPAVGRAAVRGHSGVGLAMLARSVRQVSFGSPVPWTSARRWWCRANPVWLPAREPLEPGPEVHDLFGYPGQRTWARGWPKPARAARWCSRRPGWSRL